MELGSIYDKHLKKPKNECNKCHSENHHSWEEMNDSSHKNSHGHSHGHGHKHCSCHNHSHWHHNHCFSSHHLHHSHCDDFFFKDHCCGPKAFSHKHFCNNHFLLRLSGLEGNLNFELFRKKGCCAEVKYECGESIETITGRICNFGTDFLEVLKDDKTILTIMKEKICSILWKEKCDHHDIWPSPCEENGVGEAETEN